MKANLEKKIRKVIRWSDGQDYEWKRGKRAQTLKGWVNF